MPKIEKIVLNMGVGEASQDRKKIDSAVDEMTLIAGQKAVITRARRSIAGFKLRDGMIVGCLKKHLTLYNSAVTERVDLLLNKNMFFLTVSVFV